MDEFRGKTAVVTGAASGIGFGLAERFAQEGMKVVLADVEAPALENAVATLKEREYDVIGVETDVSKPGDLDELARRTLAEYGGVHVLCNNAGVGGGAGSAWTASLAEWKWTAGINFWGVVHGIRSFVPVMIEQGEPGHVVNVASVAGVTADGSGIYSATKHAVVGFSESLYFELMDAGVPIGLSVLCPGGVKTSIDNSRRNLPPVIAAEPQPEQSEGQRWRYQRILERVFAGLEPAEVAEITLRGIRNGDFYILTDRSLDTAITERVRWIVEGRSPEFLF